MSYRCMIVDDEKLGRMLIKSHLSKFTEFVVVQECSNALEASHCLDTTEIDLLFLDVHMPQLSGIDLLRQNKHRPPTILCTAFSEYALESYELEVVDYLLKPITFDRFSNAISKFKKLEKRDAQNNTTVNIPDQPIFVKSEYKLVKIELDEILFIEAMEKYVRIHTPEERVMTLMSMSQILAMLPSSRFFRIHRSYIISIHKVNSLQGNKVQIGQHEVPVSKGNLKAFKSILDSSK